MALTTLSLMLQSAATTLEIAQVTMDISNAKSNLMTMFRNVLGSKSESTVLIMLLLVRRFYQQLCQWLVKFIPVGLG